MTSAPDDLHSGNQRWDVHCPHHHPDPGCWCYEDWITRRDRVARLVWDVIPNSAATALAVADRLLTADTLRIELKP